MAYEEKLAFAAVNIAYKKGEDRKKGPIFSVLTIFWTKWPTI